MEVQNPFSRLQEIQGGLEQLQVHEKVDGSDLSSSEKYLLTHDYHCLMDLIKDRTKDALVVNDLIDSLENYFNRYRNKVTQLIKNN